MFIYTEILYKPLFNLLIFLYNSIPGHDLGVTIIMLTLIIKLLLYPLNRRAIISQKALQTIQPQVEELKEKYKDNREKLGSAMMEMYKKEKINPFSSCLPLLIQLPILIAVYQVFVHGLNNQSFDLLYPGITSPGSLSTFAFGFLDLSKSNFVLALMAGAAQFWQTKMLMAKNQKAGSMSSAMNKQMLYMMPIMTVFIGSRFPAGLALYWFATTFFSVLQQMWMFKKKSEVQTT
jgi:YidC/Oxa1 family membrane protein insertase